MLASPVPDVGLEDAGGVVAKALLEPLPLLPAHPDQRRLHDVRPQLALADEVVDGLVLCLGSRRDRAVQSGSW